ncbi:MAG: enoyl-CoA hydratase-related protein [Pseudomonadota bacterium]
MMNSAPLIYEKSQSWHRAVLNRPDHKNSLTPELVSSLIDAVDACEQDLTASVLIIEGSNGHFCNGMDMTSAASGKGVRGAGGDAFLQLLKKLTLSSVVTISVVDGKACGGGVGLAAACDFVFATPDSQFSLPEILWGLLPCTIAPFLIRRMGYQACQSMTLSTLPISAEKAMSVGLVDATDNIALTRLVQRLQSIPPEAIGKAKRYLGNLWYLDDQVLDGTLDELDALLQSPEVSARLQGFAENKRFPWEQ